MSSAAEGISTPANSEDATVAGVVVASIVIPACVLIGIAGYLFLTWVESRGALLPRLCCCGAHSSCSSRGRWGDVDRWRTHAPSAAVAAANDLRPRDFGRRHDTAPPPPVYPVAAQDDISYVEVALHGVYPAALPAEGINPFAPAATDVHHASLLAGLVVEVQLYGDASDDDTSEADEGYGTSVYYSHPSDTHSMGPEVDGGESGTERSFDAPKEHRQGGS